MAGIGFELRRAIQSRSPLKRSGGLFSAAFTCFGGMLIGIALLTLIRIAGKANGISRDVSDLFMTYVTNTMFFSMLVTAPLSMVLTRYVSDMLYEGKYERIMPSLIGGTVCSVLGGGLLFLLFAGLSSLPVAEGALLILLFSVLCLCWIFMNYIGLLRDYQQITRAFLIALAVAGAATLVISIMRSISLTRMVFLLILAYMIVDALLFRALYRGFPAASGPMFAFVPWLKAFPSLVIISLSTEIGLLGHFWVTWYTSGESIVKYGLFVCCPSYDFPAIVAYFCSIPAMIYFIAVFEPEFCEHYHRYIDVLGCGGRNAAVQQCRDDMIASAGKGLRNYSSIQIISCLLFITVGSKLLSVLNIGMTEQMLQTFQMFCVGYSLYSVGNILMLLQMYFMNEKKAAFPAVLFAAATLVFTYIGGRMNGHASGIGLCISSTLYLMIAAVQLVRCLDNLEYHILCESAGTPAETKGIRKPAPFSTASRRQRQLIVSTALAVSLILIILPSSVMIWRAGREAYQFHFTPSVSDEVLLSPGMGYAPWANSDEGQEMDTTLVYVELRWADWEPTEGVYDIEFVNEEYRLEAYREQGRQVVFRFICDNPGETDHIDIPDWLYEATGGDGYHYTTGYGSGYSPNYKNQTMIAAHAKAVEALGDAFGRDDFFCYVELGSLGHWGEYHVNIAEGIPALPNYDIRNEYIKPYLTAFPNARFMTRYPLVETVKYGFGLYNDMTGDPEETEYWLSQMTGGVWEQTGLPEQADTREAWKKQPVGGEFASSQSDSFYLHDNLSVTLEMLRKSHQSFIGPKIIVNETAVDYSSASKAILKAVGYRYYVSSLDVDASSDDYVSIAVEVTNAGVAPTYGSYAVHLTMWDDEDNAVWSAELPGIHLDRLLPDTFQSDRIQISRDELDDEMEYTITASVVNDGGIPKVPMALEEEKADLEYILGRFRIR